MVELLVIMSIVILGLTFGFVELDIIKHTKENNRKWHVFKALYQGVIYSALSFSIYGYSYKIILFVIMFLAITVIVFNPVINKVRERNDFFYISQNGIEGMFYNTPKLYYLLNLVIAAACAYFLYLKK